MRAAPLKADKPDISGDISEEEEEGERVVVSETALKNCVLCRDKEGRNLAGLWDVKYHYAVCYYNAGAMFEVVDAGDDNSREGGVVEPVQKFRYTCPFEKCSKNEGKVKTMGFKEYAIHCGHEHSVVELAMAKDNLKNNQDEVTSTTEYLQHVGQEMANCLRVEKRGGASLRKYLDRVRTRSSSFWVMTIADESEEGEVDAGGAPAGGTPPGGQASSPRPKGSERIDARLALCRTRGGRHGPRRCSRTAARNSVIASPRLVSSSATSTCKR